MGSKDLQGAKFAAQLSRSRVGYLDLGSSHQGFLSVAVITCASHAQGRRFEPGRKHPSFASSASLAFVVEVDDTRS